GRRASRSWGAPIVAHGGYATRRHFVDFGFLSSRTAPPEPYTLSLHDALPISENIINGVERPVKAAELFAFTLRVREQFSGFNRTDRKSGSAGMPRPISYAVFCLKKKTWPTGGQVQFDTATVGPKATVQVLSAD